MNQFEQTYYSRAVLAVNEQENDIRKLNKSISDFQSLLETLREKYSEVRLQLNSIGERLNVEFGILVKDIINNVENPYSTLVELEEKVEKIRNHIGAD